MENPFNFNEEAIDLLHNKALKKIGDSLSRSTYTGRQDVMPFLLAKRYQESTRNSINYLRFVDHSIVSKSLDKLAVEDAINDSELSDEDRELFKEIKRFQGKFPSRGQKPLELLYQEMKKLDADLSYEARDPGQANDLIIGLGIYSKARVVRKLARYSWEIQQKIIDGTN